MARSTALLVALCLGVSTLACSTEDEEKAPANSRLPPLGAIELTDAALLAPLHPVSSPAEARSPDVPDERQSLLDDGFGLTELRRPGETHLTRVAGAEQPPASGAARKRLVRFVHMPDWQLADDESPTRLASFDGPGLFSPAMRPHDVDICRMVNAAVRTLNAVHAADPLDFLLLGGDNADSAQSNELEWVMALLDGSPSLHCDSGANDDPVPGPNNDGKDPFVPVALEFPWYWVTGNHDVLVQGNLAVDTKREAALGSEAPGGTRDWSQPGGPIIKENVVPDERRALLGRQELMRFLADHHAMGIGDAQLSSGKATYTFDVPGTPLRFLILDLAAETGSEKGVVREGDVNTTIKPLLEEAKAAGKWVVMASHHGVLSLGDGSGLGGSVQPDAWTADQWRELIGQYPNVVFSMVGHSHEHRVTLEGPPGARGWWEVMSSALADYPHQQRIVEIWDEDNGWLRLHSTVVDWRTDGDKVGADGRELAILDYTSGWSPGGQATVEHRNVDLWIEKPAP